MELTKVIVVSILTSMVGIGSVSAHGGSTDSFGGHYDNQSGTYHQHNLGDNHLIECVKLENIQKFNDAGIKTQWKYITTFTSRGYDCPTGYAKAVSETMPWVQYGSPDNPFNKLPAYLRDKGL